MKMLFQIILLFKCSVSLWAAILLLTIMEQYMLCACSETKGLAFPIMEHYISFALKQQSPGHQCKVLEGQPYIMQDNCFHFYHHFCIKVEWNFFTSFSKKRAKFKMSDLPLKMSSKALNYVSWKCFFKSSFCLNVVPHCEQAYCFQPLWSNTCCVLALKQKVYSFSHHGALPILCSETTSYLICM